MSIQDLVTDIEPDRIIMYGDWAQEVILDILYDENPDLEEAFHADFEIVGDKFMGDPKEDFYQGVTFITVIRRKADGRLFGYEHWQPVAKNADYDLQENGDENGIEQEYIDSEHWCPIWVWLPVKEFRITGYGIVKP